MKYAKQAGAMRQLGWYRRMQVLSQMGQGFYFFIKYPLTSADERGNENDAFNKTMARLAIKVTKKPIINLKI